MGDKTGKQKPAAIRVLLRSPTASTLLPATTIVPFGEHPLCGLSRPVQQRADGPYRGSAKGPGNCGVCRLPVPALQGSAGQYGQAGGGFPQGPHCLSDYPLESSSRAETAAAYGVCVAKQGGSTAFFQFAAAVFDGQDGLATHDSATLTLNSAVVKAGLDPVKIAACAATPATAVRGGSLGKAGHGPGY